MIGDENTPVLVRKSICQDCVWIESCQAFSRINHIDDKRNNPGHTNQKFEVIIITCSLKDIDRSYRMDTNSGMYYCTECNQMHHEKSRIGKLHKKNS